MKKFGVKTGLLTAVMVICAMLVTSCSVSKEDTTAIEVSIKNENVSPSKGQQFVSIKCNGEWKLNLVGEGNMGVDWAELNVKAGSGSKSNVILTYEGNDKEVSRSLRIVLVSGVKSRSCTMVQAPLGGQPEPEDPDTDNDTNTDALKAGWLELPAMDNPDLDYYTHSFSMNGNKYRNYTFGYSKKDYLAVWVAYPLCSLYTNGSSSGGSWEDNPLVDDKYEPNFTKSFGFSTYGYERGHQIANADRKCCAEANQQTYYFTNATLQHKDFNGPIWGTLEGNMRSAANSADTLYVVTGCTLSSSPQYVTDPDGRKVPVPSGYFKAAVRYHKASTISQWLGAAFYMEHNAAKYPSKQVTTAESMSIDELEAMLGIDFFVNLPNKIGADKAAAVEAQNPDSYTSIWSIK